MYRKKQGTCGVWCYLWFQASTGGLGTNPPQMRGGLLYSVFICSPETFYKEYYSSVSTFCSFVIFLKISPYAVHANPFFIIYHLMSWVIMGPG
jgi:hypothetical protein